MLGIFPETFPQGRGGFQSEISKVTISQLLNFPSGNFPKVRSGLLRHRRLQLGPNAAARGAERCDSDRLGKLPLGRLHGWEVFTWENTLGNLPLEVKRLGKYLPSCKQRLIQNPGAVL